MNSSLEILANAITTLSIFLAGRNSIHTWWCGILGCILFAVLFWHTQLYADVVLQLFFILTSIIGWRRWLKGQGGQALPISSVKLSTLAWLLPVGILTTLGYGAILHYWTNAYAPFIDSAVLVFSVIAQLLLMQRRLQTWVFWLLVNTIAVPLYASRGLQITALLYTAYWINAIVGWYFWHRQLHVATPNVITVFKNG